MVAMDQETGDGKAPQVGPEKANILFNSDPLTTVGNLDTYS